MDDAGRRGVIAVLFPGLSDTLTPLQHHNLAVVLRLRHLAIGHQHASGHTVRLVKFIRAETLETLS